MSAELTKLSVKDIFYDFHNTETIICAEPYMDVGELAKTIGTFNESGMVPDVQLFLHPRSKDHVTVCVEGNAQDTLLTLTQVEELISLFQEHFAHSWSRGELVAEWKRTTRLGQPREDDEKSSGN